jgi:hypothetical protein
MAYSVAGNDANVATNPLCRFAAFSNDVLNLK